MEFTCHLAELTQMSKLHAYNCGMFDYFERYLSNNSISETLIILISRVHAHNRNKSYFSLFCQSSKYKVRFNPELYKILPKSISVTNYKFHFKKYSNYFCALLWTSSPKYKIQNTFKLLTKVIEIQNTFRSHCKSINQSVNQSTSQSVNQSINQSIGQSVNHQSINQPTNQSNSQLINQSIFV